FSQPIRDNVNENISGQFGQIALKIYADELTTLQQVAEATKLALTDVPGVADLGIVKSGEVPQVQIKPRRESLGRHGMTMEELQSYLAIALGGRAVGELWEGDRSFDVVLRFPEASRETVEQISTMRIPTPGGVLIPLSVVADVSVDY